MCLASCNIPVPNGDAACSLSELESLLANPESLLGTLAFSYIETDSHHALRPPLVSTKHCSFREQPAHAAVGAQQSEFSVPLTCAFNTFPNAGYYSLAVVRMY